MISKGLPALKPHEELAPESLRTATILFLFHERFHRKD